MTIASVENWRFREGCGQSPTEGATSPRGNSCLTMTSQRSRLPPKPPIMITTPGGSRNLCVIRNGQDYTPSAGRWLAHSPGLKYRGVVRSALTASKISAGKPKRAGSQNDSYRRRWPPAVPATSFQRQLPREVTASRRGASIGCLIHMTRG
jgi:hypothetical protein